MDRASQRAAGARPRRVIAVLRRALLIPAVGLAPCAAGQHPAGDPIRHEESHRRDDVHVRPIDCFLPLGGRADLYPADSPEQCLIRFADLMSTGRYEDALPHAERLAALVPDRPEGHYNRACALARLRRDGEAIAALAKAIENGLRNDALVELDPDLATLRGDTRFDAARAEMARRSEAERLQPAALRTDDPAAVIADLEAHVPRMLAAGSVPGAAIALVRGGRVVWTGGFGTRSVTEQSAIDGATLFAVEAPVRLATLLATAQQAQAGRLDAGQVLLAVNRSRRPAGVVLIGSGAVERRAPTGEETLRALQNEVEDASDLPFRQYCLDRIFAPLGLASTAFRASEAPDAPHARGHNRFGTPDTAPRRAHAGTRVFTTAEDLGRLLAASLGGGSDAPLLAGLRCDDAAMLNGLGIGLTARSDREGARLELATSRYGLGCLMTWHPDSGAGIAILYNGETGLDAARRIAHLALAAP